MSKAARPMNGKCRYCGLDAAHCACSDRGGYAAEHEHEHEHGHGHEHGLAWADVIYLVLSAALLLASVFTAGGVRLSLRLLSYLLAGWKVLLRMARGFLKGRFFDENVLMGIATIGAICLGDYAEAAAVMEVVNSLSDREARVAL